LNESFTIAIPSDIIDLAERFLTNRRGQTQQWRQVSSRGDVEVLRRLGHELKGTAGSFGFTELARLAERLEEAAVCQDVAEARDTVERMIDFLDKATIVPC
jgi:HPt (histidine-containing phosphotransfer) domain-containing protein